MKKGLIIFVAFFLTGAAYSQNTETRNLSSFSRVQVGEAIKVYITKGTEESAKIETSGVDLDKVQTIVSGDKLRIEMKSGNFRNANVTVWLIYRNIESISISSAAKVLTENVLKSEKLRLEVSSAAEGKLEIDVDDLDVSVSSSGNLTITGRAMFQDVSVSSAGRYNAYDLICEEAEVSASSSGSARVNASKRIDASASSAGSVKYKGDPAKVRTSSSSGGSTRKSN
jgi:Putative auto-transporter adhesin, head GIN domain